MKFKSLISVLAAATLTATSMIAAAAPTNNNSFTPEQTKAMEKIIHNYIVNNPEILVEASQTLQKRQQNQMMKQAESAIDKNKQQLFNANSPVVGNKSGSVVLVEFFDYQCIHCKQMGPVVSGLIQKNPNLKVIYKEFPIFGANSKFAASAALAAQKQGKYKEFHDAMMKTRTPLNKDRVMEIAKKAGLNVQQLEKDMAAQKTTIKQELDANYKLARALGLVGTPAFVVAGNVNSDNMKSFFIPGAANQQKLQGLIDQAK